MDSNSHSNNWILFFSEWVTLVVQAMAVSFKWITSAVRKDAHVFGMGYLRSLNGWRLLFFEWITSVFEQMKILFEQITSAVQTDEDFFPMNNMSCSNGWRLFQTDNSSCLNGWKVLPQPVQTASHWKTSPACWASKKSTSLATKSTCK